jgi:hypothetical protein
MAVLNQQVIIYFSMETEMRNMNQGQGDINLLKDNKNTIKE